MGKLQAILHASTPVRRCAPALLLALAAGQVQAQADAASHYGAIVDEYCIGCHNVEDFSGGLALDLSDIGNPASEAEVWEEVIVKLRGRLMPPAGADQPSQLDVDALVAHLEGSIDGAGLTGIIGHTPIQRLNRTEFATAVKGLLGVELDPTQILPGDIEVEGFDNIANALSAPPAFLEQYISAARLAATRAIGAPVPKFAKQFHAINNAARSGYRDHVDGFPLGTRGGMRFSHFFPADGEYRFSILDIDAGLYPRGMETAATMVILVDGVEVNRVEIGGPEDLELADREGVVGGDMILAKIAGLPAFVKAGTREVTVTFIERSWAASNNQTGNGRVSGMPRLGLGVEVEGPYNPAGISQNHSRDKIFVCQPSELSDERACAEQIARSLATRAFRRPVGDDDLEWLMPFYESARQEEGGFEAGITELVTAILSSPDFLYRAIASLPDAPRPLDGLELASRLSFFLWSQGPDDELIELGASGLLLDEETLEAQVLRMLDDPRAEALVENFALAWLNLDELEAVIPQGGGFNENMRRN